MIHNLHDQPGTLERAAREIMRTACGQRVGLMTRAKVHSIDFYTSHRPLSRWPQSWPSSQIRQQSFLILFRTEIKIAIHIQIGIQHARWSVGSGTERGPTSRLLRNERKKPNWGAGVTVVGLGGGRRVRLGWPRGAGHKPAARSPGAHRRR